MGALLDPVGSLVSTLLVSGLLLFTPALATSQPQCEFPETISTSSHIIHTADEEFICPGKYCWQIFAQLQIFQGNLQKH